MTAIKRDKANEFFDSIPNASNGQIFVGAGLGWSRYDPEYECGGSGNTHRRQCPHVSADTVAKSSIGSNRKIHIDIASYRDSLRRCSGSSSALSNHSLSKLGYCCRTIPQGAIEIASQTIVSLHPK